MSSKPAWTCCALKKIWRFTSHIRPHESAIHTLLGQIGAIPSCITRVFELQYDETLTSTLRSAVSLTSGDLAWSWTKRKVSTQSHVVVLSSLSVKFSLIQNTIKRLVIFSSGVFAFTIFLLFSWKKRENSLIVYQSNIQRKISSQSF